jgi:alpha-tubulin suppressor-like RCC1 family protein
MMTMGVTDVETGEFRRRPYRVAPLRDPNTIATLEGGREYAVSLYTVTSTPFPDPGEYSLVLDPQPITASDYLGGTGPDLEPNDFNASAGANAVPPPPFSVTGSVFSVDGIIGDVDSYRILGDVGTHVGITLVNNYPGANMSAVFGWRPDPSGGVIQPDRSAGAGPAATLSHAWPIEETHPHYLMLHSTSTLPGGWNGGPYELSTWVPEVFNQISAGTDHSCGAEVNGDAMCWGRNAEGQLGVGAGVTDSNVPLEVPGGGLVQIDAGFTHSCGVDNLGKGYCWGQNTYGQLGDGTTTDSSTPVEVADGHIFLAVEAGGGFSCGVDTTGDVWCWGDGSFGKLGDGTGASSLDPVRVLTPGAGIGYQFLSVGNSHACAYADTRHLWCWGDNGFGQLGDGTSIGWSLSPVRVGGMGVDSFWKDVSVGFNHTCGIDLAGSILCWGNNSYGQLGDETTTHRSLPVLVTQGLFYADLDAAQEFTCGITDDAPNQNLAEVNCWGRNDHGQLGDGTIDDRGYPAPIVMDSNRRAFYQVEGGTYHTCALTVGQVAWCWGHNHSGQLGDSTNRSILKPTAVRNR